MATLANLDLGGTLADSGFAALIFSKIKPLQEMRAG
jgi:hypothetical protein